LQFKWQKGVFYEHCETGKPIRIKNVPKAIVLVKLFHTREVLVYTYKKKELIIENPVANPDGLHEVIE
jgi:hypothetical protein